jgi:cysteinyl-tRNA synthetase
VAPAPDGLGDHEDRFYAALADDFRTPAALREVFDWTAEANRRIDRGERVGAGALPEMLGVLGLETLLEPDPDEEIDPRALDLLSGREAARASGDYERADRIRDEIAALGYEVRDTPQGARLASSR